MSAFAKSMIASHRLPFRKLFSYLNCALVLVVSSGSSALGSVQFNIFGNSDPANTAVLTLTYQSMSDIAATLTLDVENTSGFDVRITAVGANNPIATLTSINLSSVSGTQDDAAWSVLFDSNNIGTPQPLGVFDIAAVTGNTNGPPSLNGGSPNDGIAIGDTGTFVLDLIGTGLDDQSDSDFEMDFQNELSFMDNNNDVPSAVAVRFQRTGANGGGSDVGIPGIPPPGPMGNPDVPEPASWLVWTLLSAAVGCSARRSK